MNKKTDETLNMVGAFGCGLAAGIIITLIFIFFTSMLTSAGSFWKSESLRLSTKELIQEIRADNGMIPDSAYDIYYQNDKGGRDLSRWISYRASDLDIESFLDEMRSNASQTKLRWPTAPMAILTDEEIDNNNPRYEDWWPKSAVGLEVIHGERFCIGYDSQSNRIYYYQFTI